MAAADEKFFIEMADAMAGDRKPQMGSWFRACRRIVRRAASVFNRFVNLYPKRTECNICGWQGRRFDSDEWHKHVACPRCRSVVRHRLLQAVLFHGVPTDRSMVSGKSVLHFAPERVLKDAIRPRAARYVTADVDRPDVDLNLDITNMSRVGADEFDVVIACDVLEHVGDDRTALREIRRVLRSGGSALLTVPQKDHLEDTFEDPAIVEPADRERVFGQFDHVRIYGDSFPGILESAGFAVSVVTDADFSAATVARHVLRPPVLSTHPLATNYRKVFIARKVPSPANVSR
jgi:SAM-dependent methyltransferase